jgi:hypothetical protein
LRVKQLFQGKNTLILGMYISKCFAFNHQFVSGFNQFLPLDCQIEAAELEANGSTQSKRVKKSINIDEATVDVSLDDFEATSSDFKESTGKTLYSTFLCRFCFKKAPVILILLIV